MEKSGQGVGSWPSYVELCTTAVVMHSSKLLATCTNELCFLGLMQTLAGCGCRMSVVIVDCRTQCAAVWAVNMLWQLPTQFLFDLIAALAIMI